MGITECGHLFSFTCLHNSINYKKECPQCRRIIDKETIFLYDDNPNLTEMENIKSIVGDLGTKISNLINLIYSLKDNCLIFSNYDDNLDKIHHILTQLNISVNYITRGKKLNICNNKKGKSKPIVYLINYKYNFYKLDKLYNLKYIIFNDPYYQLNINIKKTKYLNILSLFDKIKLYHLVIQDTIEQDIFTQNNSIIQNILNSKKKDYIEL